MKKIPYVISLALILSSYNAMAAKGVSDKQREFLNNNNQQSNFKNIRFDKFHFIPTHMNGKLGSFHKNNPQATLKAFLNKNKEVFRFTERTQFKFLNSNISSNGISHHFFSQSIDNVPVKGIRLSMHSNTNASQIESINTHLVSEDDVITTPNITLAQAKLLIEGELNANEVITNSEGELILLPVANKPAELNWLMNVQYLDVSNVKRDQSVYVNALTGRISQRLSNIYYAFDIKIRDANHTTSHTGTVVLASVSSTPVPVNQSDEDEIKNLRDNFADTYSQFESNFKVNNIGWKSFDNNDTLIKASINSEFIDDQSCSTGECPVSQHPNNANFSPSDNHFGFGNGDGARYAPLGNALDVVVHEFTHGVNYTRLNNTHLHGKEAAAIGESLGDIFAAAIETKVNTGSFSSPNNNTWKVFESVYTPGGSIPNDAARYMNDPAIKVHESIGSPNRAFDYYPEFDAVVGDTSEHAGAGISNLAFYLLSQGGFHPRGKTTTHVSSIGLSAAIQVFWDAYNYMSLNGQTNNYTFAELRQATAQAVSNDPQKQEQVCKAWDAVGVEGSGTGYCSLGEQSLHIEWLGCDGNTPRYLAVWSNTFTPESYDVNFRLSTTGSFSPLYNGSGTSKEFNGKPYMPASVQMRVNRFSMWSPYINRSDPTTSCRGGGL